MMEGPRHQHLHQEWQEPLEERSRLSHELKQFFFGLFGFVDKGK